jgi:hypothetical protein
MARRAGRAADNAPFSWYSPARGRRGVRGVSTLSPKSGKFSIRAYTKSFWIYPKVSTPPDRQNPTGRHPPHAWPIPTPSSLALTCASSASSGVPSTRCSVRCLWSASPATAGRWCVLATTSSCSSVAPSATACACASSQSPNSRSAHSGRARTPRATRPHTVRSRVRHATHGRVPTSS